MVKAEWGTKRTCPKCGERFYDLGKASPCVCIECATEWVPEPILKTKQPIVVEEKPEEPEESEDEDSDEVDLTVDDDASVLGDVSLDDTNDTEVSTMVDPTLSSDDA